MQEQQILTRESLGIIDVNGNPLKSEETLRAEEQPTHDEKRAAALKASPDFVRMQKKVEKVMKQLEYSHPGLSASEKLQRAAKIVVGLEPKPTVPHYNSPQKHPAGSRALRRAKKR